MPTPVTKQQFQFVYSYRTSGDSYFGSVIDDGSQGLRTGRTIAGKDGTYTIGASTPADAGAAVGTVQVTSYFRAAAARTLETIGGQSGQSPSGTAGLGSERDRPLFLPDVSFGPSTPLSAHSRVYGFIFTYPDGNSYEGEVGDDGRYGYQPGKVIPTGQGSYLITDVVAFDRIAPGQVRVHSYSDARTGTTYTLPQTGGTTANAAGLGSERARLPQSAGGGALGLGGRLEPHLPLTNSSGAIYVWTGGTHGAFNDPANWQDIRTHGMARQAPGANDIAWFAGGTAEVTGAVNRASLLVDKGARVTLRGTPQDSHVVGRMAVIDGGRLTIRGAKLGRGGDIVIGPGSVLDISRRTALPPRGNDDTAGRFESLTLQGPAGSRPGGRLDLGEPDLALNSIWGPVNRNAGSGNSFDAAAGISGSGDFLPPFTDQPEPIVTPLTGPLPWPDVMTTIDFGTVHVGETVLKGFGIENGSGNAGPELYGAVQSAAHGGSVTDPRLSGAGTIAQDFTINGRGGLARYPIILHATTAGPLRGQAVHIAYGAGVKIDGGRYFDGGQTLPITGKVLNHAAPAFIAQSGPGRLSHSGNAWTLDLGTLHVGDTDKLVSLAVANAAAGPSDLLSGNFSVAENPGIRVNGANSFAGLEAEELRGGLRIMASAAAPPGAHSATLVLHPTGSNASGYAAALPDQTLTVRDVVVA
ncbi:conserved protein of unknown function [Rhodovastum atsumiense]|uniref:Uncharacterized protein n=1 Tax=Rhodovastum atsumiense TaxID=504468 RepID=A0A5M6ISP9_9PROT|nr:hypothetical protein [Rhodovastum atsumiense]KAA5610867.1 hypothetical protein F1189_17485 [Rhodovastum atsumiense]CAH2602077.1 conserved protein of unknown function [Rhodovastum atsumiense]